MYAVYVAGAYSSDNLITLLDNMRKGMNLSHDILKAGYAPFVPWFDYHFSLISNDMTIDDYYNYTLEWLSRADAMILVPGYENSVGTANEIDLAKELGIPIFNDIESLNKHFTRNGLTPKQRENHRKMVEDMTGRKLDRYP